MTSTPTKPVDNVVIATKGLQDRTTNITAGTTVENKGKLILTDINARLQYFIDASGIYYIPVNIVTNMMLVSFVNLRHTIPGKIRVRDYLIFYF